MKILKLYKDSFAGLPPPIWLLSIVMLVNRAGAMVLPFMSLYLKKELDYSLQEIGLVMASLGFGALTGTYIGGKLVDRFGQYNVQIGSLLLSGIMFMVFPLLEGIVELMIGMFVLMTIVDTFRPANTAALAIYSSPELQPRAVSLNRLSMNLGFTIGPGLAGMLAVKYGYQVLFIADAVTCWIAAVMLLVYLKKKEEPKSNTSQRKEAYQKTLFVDRTYHIFLLLCFLVAFCFIQFFSVFPVYLEDGMQFSESEIGRLLGLSGLIIFALEMPMVHVALQKGLNALTLIKIGAFLLSLSYVSLALPNPTLIILILFISLFSVGEILALPFQTSFALKRAHPTIRGAYLGFYGITWSLAQIVGPPIAFYVAHKFGFKLLWIGNAVILLSAAIGFGQLQEKRNKS